MIKNVLFKWMMICMFCNSFNLFSSISTTFSEAMEAVIFDCDGVLVDTEYLKFLAWQNALVSFNTELSIEEYKALIGHTSKKILPTFWRGGQLPSAAHLPMPLRQGFMMLN